MRGVCLCLHLLTHGKKNQHRKRKWIGGYKRDGENVTTLQGLEEILANKFKLIDTIDVPFVIQETARKHQHTVAQMSIWEKI